MRSWFRAPGESDHAGEPAQPSLASRLRSDGWNGDCDCIIDEQMDVYIDSSRLVSLSRSLSSPLDGRSYRQGGPVEQSAGL